MMMSRFAVGVTTMVVMSVMASNAMAERIIVQTVRQPTVSPDVAVGGESVVLGAAAPVIVHSVRKPVEPGDKKDSDSKDEEGSEKTADSKSVEVAAPATAATPAAPAAPAASSVVVPASTTAQPVVESKVAPAPAPVVAASSDDGAASDEASSDETTGDTDEGEAPLEKKDEKPKGYAARNGMYFELTGLMNYAGFKECDKAPLIKDVLCPKTAGKQGIGGGAALGFGYVIKNWVGLGVSLGGEYLKLPDRKFESDDISKEQQGHFVTLDATFMLELFPFAGLSVGAGAGYAASVAYNGKINSKLFSQDIKEFGYKAWVKGGLMFRGSVGYEFMVTDTMSIGLKFLYTRYDVSNLTTGDAQKDSKAGIVSGKSSKTKAYEQEFGGLLMFRWY